MTVEATSYQLNDQHDKLGEPPWSGEAVEAWEAAHGHDPRLNCYPEYGCQIVERDRRRYRQALEHLADDKRRPCKECGQTHERRVKPNRAVTWADPDDGHYYQQIDRQEFARRALNWEEEPA